MYNRLVKSGGGRTVQQLYTDDGYACRVKVVTDSDSVPALTLVPASFNIDSAPVNLGESTVNVQGSPIFPLLMWLSSAVLPGQTAILNTSQTAHSIVTGNFPSTTMDYTSYSGLGKWWILVGSGANYTVPAATPNLDMLPLVSTDFSSPPPGAVIRFTTRGLAGVLEGEFGGTGVTNTSNPFTYMKIMTYLELM